MPTPRFLFPLLIGTLVLMAGACFDAAELPDDEALAVVEQEGTVATCPAGSYQALSRHNTGSYHSTSQTTCWNVARADYNLAVAQFNVDCAGLGGTSMHAEASETESMSYDHFICIKISHAVCCKTTPDGGPPVDASADARRPADGGGGPG